MTNKKDKKNEQKPIYLELSQQQRDAIEDFFFKRKTAKQICDELGFTWRNSFYSLYKSKKAQAYLKDMVDATVKATRQKLQLNADHFADVLMQIADGDIKDTKAVYAQLQAIAQILNVTGLNKQELTVNVQQKDDGEDLMKVFKQMQKQ